MYSWEISQILQDNNYNIESNTYIKICITSPQITHVKFEPCGQFYEMWDNENNYWKFTVYRKEINYV